MYAKHIQYTLEYSILEYSYFSRAYKEVAPEIVILERKGIGTVFDEYMVLGAYKGIEEELGGDCAGCC